MQITLKGKTALVTGGNTGIGRAVSTALAGAGANLVIAWHQGGDTANELATALTSSAARAIAIEADVTNENSVLSLWKTAAADLGQVDILVNNAGIQSAQPILEMAVEDFDRMMAVHLRGAFLNSREMARQYAGNDGRIINVCSQLGYIGRENYTAYSSAKGGLIAFTRALARELAPRGILVNGVSPGLVDTGFDPLTEEAKTAHALSLPLQRLGTPDDMVGAFTFLASDAGRYYCGQMLHPNGGEIMP
jgi:3-oxoacyl-[acyl-carrier protein] reductase